MFIFVWIVDQHCLEVFVCFVDIGGIIVHHCLEVILCFVDIDVNCWSSLFRGDCSLCWRWCELLTITAYRSLFALLILVWIVENHYLEVNVHFVDIGMNCWQSLLRDDCSLCWYWWNCWPSLFLEMCVRFDDIDVNCWLLLLRGVCLLCLYWCELLTNTI